MSIFRKIIQFFKNLKKDKNILNSSGPILKLNEAKESFRDSIKIDVNKKSKIEVIKNIKDGTGILTRIRN